MIAIAEEFGVRGKLDLMSNVFTIMKIISWMESAREINPHYLYFETCISIILLFRLFYYYSYFIISLYGRLLKVTPS